MADSNQQLAVSTGGFTLSAEEVLMGRGFITGKSGSGKSNTASVITEELLEQNLGLLIVDTEGEYTSLKEEYDLIHVGKGDDCDMDVSAEGIERLTRLALDDLAPILLDISTYEDETETENILYEVVNALFVAEHDKRTPFLLLVEEAHEFIPQRGGSSDLKSLLIRVAKRGRKRGLGICCMSQRPASVDKDYITQCNWFIWHRLTWENDTAVVDRILGGDAADTVQTLDDGEAIVLTDWDDGTARVQFRRKRTRDASATPSLDDLNLVRRPQNQHRQNATAESENTSKGKTNTSTSRAATAGETNQSDVNAKTAADSSRPADQPSSDSNQSGTDESEIEGDSMAADAGAVEEQQSPSTADPHEPGDPRPGEQSVMHGGSRDGAVNSNPSVSDDSTDAEAHTPSTGTRVDPLQEPGSPTGGTDQANGKTASVGDTDDPSASTGVEFEKVATTDRGHPVDSYGVRRPAETFSRRKPTLERRRQRRQTPDPSDDSVWELGSMVVYLYDTLVWFHQYLVYVLESLFVGAVRRIEGVAWNRRWPRQPGVYERYLYRFLSIIVILSAYAILVYSVLFVT